MCALLLLSCPYVAQSVSKKNILQKTVDQESTRRSYGTTGPRDHGMQDTKIPGAANFKEHGFTVDLSRYPNRYLNSSFLDSKEWDVSSQATSAGK